MLDGRKTRIIVALISTLGALVVAYWQFVRKPSSGTGELIPYVVRVTNIDTRQAISGAKVIIEASGLPPSPYTDVNGISPFKLDKAIETVHIIVESKDCEIFDKHEPLPKSEPRNIDIRLKCAEPKSRSLGLTYDHNPTVDEVRSDIERVRRVTITYRNENCRKLIGKAVVRLNGAQLNGLDAKDILENAAKPRTDKQFSVITRQEGSSYEITCDK